MNCKNCGTRVEDKFCSHCGQKSTIARITFSNFINEVSASFFHNKGFFYTLGELSTRPGKSIRDFLNGKRKSHFKPIAYLLTLSTLYFITAQITNQNTLIGDVLEGWMSGPSSQNSNKDIPAVAAWFLSNYAYATLLLLPVFSLASYIAFLKFGQTYLEHVVLNSYITGHQAIIYSLFLVGGTVLKSDIMEMLPSFLAVSYTFWVFWQFFSKGIRVVNVLRSFLTYMLYLIFITLLLATLMINSS